MKRGLLIAAVVTTTVGAAVGAIGAGAAPIVPMHEVSSTTAVHGVVRALDLADDFGNVVVKAGTNLSVAAHEQWNYEQPTLTVTVKNQVLSVRATCPNLVSGPYLYIGDPGVNDCAIDLTVVVPARTDLTVTSYGGAVTSTGINGVQKLKGYSGTVTVTGSRSRALTVESEGVLAVTHSTLGLAALTADNSRATLDDVTANVASVRAEGGDAAVTASHVTRALSVVSDVAGVTLRNVSAGQLTATSESGQVSVESTNVVGSAALTGNNGSITVGGLTAGQLAAKAYGGPVVVKNTTVRRDATVVAEDGSVTTESVRAASLSVEAASGTASLSSSTVTGLVHLTADNGGADVNDLRAGQLVVNAAGGAVSIGSTAVRGQLSVTNHNGGATLAKVSADGTSIHATGGSLSGSDLSSPLVSATNDNGPVTLALLTVPSHVVMEGSSNIGLTVPSATYAVNAVSDSRGAVTVSGIVVHSDAKRTLTAHTTQGAISITGRS
ncbi:MAG TPA: DUF4097 family beta strand repeat-containing protein [Mycobacteriales bacterium]|nr:DUF4097 family beta strand repeat-containing protein [Mycobacteriales bacterium]